jgi:capsular polysaccharide biosynthesis protein
MCFVSLESVPGFATWGSSAMAQNVRVHNLGPALVSPTGVIFVDGVALAESFRGKNFTQNEILITQASPNVCDINIKSALHISSPSPQNYFHFLFDYVSRLALSDAVSAVCGNEKLSHNLRPYQYQILSGLGLSLNNMIFNSAAWISVDRLMAIEQLGFGSYFSPQVLRLMQSLRDAVCGNMQPIRSRIFISRRMQRARSICNIESVERIATQEGFEIVRPETLSFLDQVRLFFHASVVVGASGAAFSNLAFCSPGATVLDLRPLIPTLPHASFFWRNYAKECEIHYCALDTLPDGNVQSTHHDLRFVVDEELFRVRLRELCQSQ